MNLKSVVRYIELCHSCKCLLACWQRTTNERNSNSVKSVYLRMAWSASNFYFGELIGEGLFGKVYHAKCKKGSCDGSTSTAATTALVGRLPTDVAIKVMDKLQIMKGNKTKMILRERSVLTKLSQLQSNRYSARLIMSFVDQHNLYLVQELCTFGSLSSLRIHLRIHLRHDQQISRKEAIWHYSGQILSAIEFMHSHSIVHCDLKPENVMISNHCILIASNNNNNNNNSNINMVFECGSTDAVLQVIHRSR